jgi:hypothetical protein
VWCLFWFDVAYVCVRLIAAAVGRVQKRRQAQQLPAGSVAAPQHGVSSKSSSLSDQRDVSITVGDDGSKGTPLTAAQGNTGSRNQQAATGSEPCSMLGSLPVPAVLAGMAALIVVFTVVAFAGLMATYNNRKVRPPVHCGARVSPVPLVVRASCIGPPLIAPPPALPCVRASR